VASQAFVDTYGVDAITRLLPNNKIGGLDLKPTQDDAKAARAWTGLDAHSAIIELVNGAIEGLQ
jgi:hypothetical protein